ncbi:MAG: hypothetical protein ABSA74_01230 [Candidatus Staskawiczbacteria bacterium]|jgi:hypothetical protein
MAGSNKLRRSWPGGFHLGDYVLLFGLDWLGNEDFVLAHVRQAPKKNVPPGCVPITLHYSRERLCMPADDLELYRR